MLLRRMKMEGSLPKKADKAELRFGYKNNRGVLPLPRRIGRKIILPDNSGDQFFSLKRGFQFLFIFQGRELWFGGTDESPFLVRLNWYIQNFENIFSRDFKRVKEKTFYNSLKPEIVQKTEKSLDTIAKRQGDIWAVPLELSIKDFLKNGSLFLGRELKVITVKRLAILNTRHKLTGQLILNHGVVNHDSHCSGNSPIMVGQGVLRSSNRSPLNLKGMHVLAQTAYLYNSSKPD